MDLEMLPSSYFPQYPPMVPYVSDQSLEGVTAELNNKDLWKQFCLQSTEMVITKSGRNAFPHFEYAIKGLNPEHSYAVYLDFELASKCRYKYCKNIGWQPAGTEETQSYKRIVSHPESPQTGLHWMKNGIQFKSVKLTNTPHPATGQVVLNSMHKYQPVLIIVSNTEYPRMQRFRLSETQFVAVTAYQNKNITSLKINNNKFAKGFRLEGKANTKRKRELSDKKEDSKKFKEKDENIEEVSEDESRCSSTASSSINGSLHSSESNRTELSSTYQEHVPSFAYYPEKTISPMMYPQYPYYYNLPNYWSAALYPYCRHFESPMHSRLLLTSPNNSTHRSSNFSIESILSRKS